MIRLQPVERENWRAGAACRDSDPELFFPTATSGPAYERQVAEAKSVCDGCWVAPSCLDEAMTVREDAVGSVDAELLMPDGVAGGLDEHERRQAWREGQRMRAALEQARTAVAEGAEQPGGSESRREEVARWHTDDQAAHETAAEDAWSR